MVVSYDMYESYLWLKEEIMSKEQLKLFYDILDTKNSWGKNEIKKVLLEIVSGIRTSV